jgi:hypothetical protein
MQKATPVDAISSKHLRLIRLLRRLNVILRFHIDLHYYFCIRKLTLPAFIPRHSQK